MPPDTASVIACGAFQSLGLFSNAGSSGAVITSA
jgi:hypothetical protein